MEKMKSYKENWKNTLELIFKIEFLFYVCLSYNNIFFGKKIMSAFVIVSTFLGVTILVIRLIDYKKYKDAKLFTLILAFLISYLITIISNYKYGFLDGIKNLTWMTFQLLIIYLYKLDDNSERYKKDFKILSNCYLLYMFLASFWSILQFYSGNSDIKYKNSSGYVIPSGFIWGRLWGVFTDPNQGSVYACIAIVLSIYFIIAFNKKKPLGKIATALYSINILIQIIYIAFSDSRTGMVCFSIGMAFLSYMILIKKIKIQNNFNRYIACFIASLSIFFISIIIPVGVRSFNNYIQDTKVQKEIENPKKNDKNKIGRKDDIESDLSNRRFLIWKSSIEIFSTKPILGVSHTNLNNYAYKKLPKTYIINNTQHDFQTSHNMFLDVLTGQGVVGFTILITMIISSMLFIFKRINKLEGMEYFYITIMLTCIAICFTSCVFMTEIFYVNSPIAFMFWSMLGYINQYLFVKDKEEINQKN